MYSQPASKIKELGFKTKKQFFEFSISNGFQTKGFKSETEFNNFYKNKLKQFHEINEIMTESLLY